MRIESGQRYRNQNGALIKVLEPSLFDENGEEYFTQDTYDPYRKKWCGASLRHYKRDDCLVGLTLVENSDV